MIYRGDEKHFFCVYYFLVLFWRIKSKLKCNLFYFSVGPYGCVKDKMERFGTNAIDEKPFMVAC